MSADAIDVTHLELDGSFTIVGWEGSEPVLATFENRELRCSSVLLDKAEQLTWDLAATGTDARSEPEVFLGGESLVVLFTTFLSLFDRVSAADISTPPKKGRRPASTPHHSLSRGALRSYSDRR